MPQSKPLSVDASRLDSQSRSYMIGHQMMTKQQLRTALAEAENDPDLRGKLRDKVIERYRIRLSGGHF